MAPTYFVDTSALAKRYVVEVGSPWLHATLDPAISCSVYIVRIAAVELISAVTRRERSGTLAPNDAAIARSGFRTHMGNEYKIIEVTESLVNNALILAEKHGLRGYDAVQLSAAIEVNTRYLATGMSSITLICADSELNTAAVREGLTVENPNSHV